MDFDPRDYDSRDEDRFNAGRSRGVDSSDPLDRDDDWRQRDTSPDRDDDAPTLGRGPGDSRNEVLLDRRAEVFDGARFTLLYRRWLKEGDVALEALSSTVIADALATGSGIEECLVLPERPGTLRSVRGRLTTGRTCDAAHDAYEILSLSQRTALQCL